MSTMNRDELDRDTRIDLRVWRRIWSYAARHPRRVAALAVLAVTTAISQAGFPLVTRALVDEVAQRGAAARLARHGLSYGVLVVVFAASVWGFVRVAGTIRAQVAHDMRTDGFRSLMAQSHAFHDRHSVGWLMARMTADAERLSNVLAWGTLDVVWGFTSMTAVGAALLWLSPSLGALVLAILPVLAAVSWKFQRRMLVVAREVRGLNSRITASFNEEVAGVATTKAFRREPRADQEFGALAGRMHDASRLNANLAALYPPLVVTLASLATGLALAVGGGRVVVAGMSVGTLVGFLAYTRSFFEPVSELAARFAEMQNAQAAAERVLALIEAEPEVRDSAEARTASAADSVERVGSIRFEEVQFAYGEGPQVIQGVDLELRLGETVALVGPTGGGKTTLASLLCRFYEPTAGRITFDGVDVQARALSWLARTVAVVPQTPYLFRGSILENVRYGRLDATDAEVRTACERVGLERFVADHVDGYLTDVGEAGERLSAGERQLVSVARALVADPAVLVLDEATSAVDTETEMRLQAALAELRAGRTCLVIAHRLSTVRDADRILFVDEGRIVESGTHADLLAARGRYRELVLGQRLDPGALRRAWAEAEE